MWGGAQDNGSGSWTCWLLEVSDAGCVARGTEAECLWRSAALDGEPEPGPEPERFGWWQVWQR